MIKRTDDLSMPSDRKAFRDRLMTRMREKKITGAELARAAKVSKDAISTYTTMRSLPTPKTLARLAQVLDCKPHDLLPDKPLNESLLEMREHAKPGYKILVVRMTLPAQDCMKQYQALLQLEQKFEKKLSSLDAPLPD